MKLVLIGMDGGHLEAYQRGWTPFLESLLGNAKHAEISEDLIGRGWSKIITGEPGSVTGAIYDRPELNGTHDWSLKFSLKDIPGIGDSTDTIWSKLNARGFKVGIMNVPTAFPASQVNGFFISGGGGGGAVVQKPTADLCHPPEICDYLVQMGYVVDERLGSMLAEKKLYKADDFFERYAHKNNRRTKAFVDLSKQFGIDFGFVVYKSSSNIAEFLLLPELASAKIEHRTAASELTCAIKSYYSHFDDEIKTIYESFPDAELVFVSDHGMAVREYSFNPNKLLQKLGLQKPSGQKRKVFDIIRFAKKFIPYSLRVAIRNNKRVKKAYESMITFNPSTSVAFSNPIGDWKHGVFVNDQVRFGGPIPFHKIEHYKREIVDKINSDPEAQAHGIAASVRPNPDGAPEFPDVILHVPDGYISSSDCDVPIKKFVLPGGPHSIATVTQGELLCGKSSKAMAITVGGDWSVSREYSDLTLVHHYILDRFKIEDRAS